MTSRRRSTSTRSVPAQTPEQLLELAQEHIRPLIGVIDRLNEADAEDELRVISKQLTRLCFRVQPLPSEPGASFFGAVRRLCRSARHPAALTLMGAPEASRPGVRGGDHVKLPLCATRRTHALQQTARMGSGYPRDASVAGRPSRGRAEESVLRYYRAN